MSELIETFRVAVLTILEEGYDGPPQAKETWFVDNDRDAGLIRTLGKVTAEEASRRVGDETTIAGHAFHVAFALDLANRAMRGEDAHTQADWNQSWTVTQVNREEWDAVRSRLSEQYEETRELIGSTPETVWSDRNVVTGIMGEMAHGAWHLGAIRKMLEVLRQR